MKDKISPSVLLFTTTGFIQSSTIIVSYVTDVSGRDTWIMVLLGPLLFMPILAIYLTLAQRFPGKTLIEIHDIVLGKVVGKIFSAFYIVFFFMLCFLNLDNMSEFVVGTIMPETPKAAVLALFMAACCYAVRKDTRSLTRWATLMVMGIFIATTTNTLLLSNLAKIEHFQPVMNQSPGVYFHALMNLVFIPYAETIVLWMLFPIVEQPTKLKKPMIAGAFLGTLSLLIVATRDVSVLGDAVTYFTTPTYEAIRMINLADVLTRMEILYAIVLLVLLFYKISMLLYGCVKGIEQVFKLQSYQSLVWPVGVLVACYSLASFDSPLEQAFWGKNYASVFSSFFELVLPLITLCVAALRGFLKKPKPKEVPQAS